MKPVNDDVDREVSKILDTMTGEQFLQWRNALAWQWITQVALTPPEQMHSWDLGFQADRLLDLLRHGDARGTPDPRKSL